jgi:hypothetical protein
VNKQGEQAYGAEWALQGCQKASEGILKQGLKGAGAMAYTAPRQGVIEGIQRLSLLCKKHN